MNASEANIHSTFTQPNEMMKEEELTALSRTSNRSRQLSQSDGASDVSGGAPPEWADVSAGDGAGAAIGGICSGAMLEDYDLWGETQSFLRLNNSNNSGVNIFEQSESVFDIARPPSSREPSVVSSSKNKEAAAGRESFNSGTPSPPHSSSLASTNSSGSNRSHITTTAQRRNKPSSLPIGSERFQRQQKQKPSHLEVPPTSAKLRSPKKQKQLSGKDLEKVILLQLKLL